jgi:hypothetical protein
VETVAAVATLLRGWKAYFQYGYPRRIFRRLNYDVQVRFRCFLRNRSQRRSRRFGRGRVSMRVCNATDSATCDAVPHLLAWAL